MVYKFEDLSVHDDPIGLIRRKPDLFAGQPPRAKRLVGKLLSDLVHFGVTSVSAEAYDEWWLVISQSDWLEIDGLSHAEYWRQIRAAPEVGLQAMRPEALLTAFSSVLFTVAKSSMEFIVGTGEIGHARLRVKAQALLIPEFKGRAVGFLINE